MRPEDEKQPYVVSIGELHEMLQDAARKGATQALEDLGLTGFTRSDFAELRSLVDGWRSTKSAIWSTVVKGFTIAVLATLAAGASVKLGLWNG